MRFLVGLALLSSSAPMGSRAETTPSYPKGDPALVEKYVQYDRLWFENGLPLGSVEIEWGAKTGTWYTKYEGEGFHARIVIFEGIRGYENAVCIDVLHEMVHLDIAKRDRHLFDHGNVEKGKDKKPKSGPQEDYEDGFQKNMLKLAKKGAFKGCW